MRLRGQRLSGLAALLAVALGVMPAAHAGEPSPNLAWPSGCERLLEQAVELTEEAYKLDGWAPAVARSEALRMSAEMFFFWPSDYFLVAPGITAPDFIRLGKRMGEVWALSRTLNCGIAFHPIPES